MSEEFSSHFSEDRFWEKIKKFCIKAGLKVVYTALLLYYTLQDPRVPVKAKAIIAGALGYFILPVDVIPDLLPMVGFTDDYGVLFAALATVAMHITPESKAKAKAKVNDFFGTTVDEDELMEVEKGLAKTD
ncbi:MAG: YkvA family protein, partial [Firmicutes bacterium]|nr:YkvA family protein [Bacillota bacterium]